MLSIEQTLTDRIPWLSQHPRIRRPVAGMLEKLAHEARFQPYARPRCRPRASISRAHARLPGRQLPGHRARAREHSGRGAAARRRQPSAGHGRCDRPAADDRLGASGRAHPWQRRADARVPQLVPLLLPWMCSARARLRRCAAFSARWKQAGTDHFPGRRSVARARRRRARRRLVRRFRAHCVAQWRAGAAGAYRRAQLGHVLRLVDAGQAARARRCCRAKRLAQRQQRVGFSIGAAGRGRRAEVAQQRLDRAGGQADASARLSRRSPSWPDLRWAGTARPPGTDRTRRRRPARAPELLADLPDGKQILLFKGGADSADAARNRSSARTDLPSRRRRHRQAP